MGVDTVADDTAYGPDFFAGIDAGSRRSARIVVPQLLEIFEPQSVVDVGGGAGHWGAECLARGVREVLTVDGPWVPQTARATPPDCFLEHDLSQPLTLARRFDLAICLEAAEHLPAATASQLVETLTRLAPVVVFSAAMPGQGGDGHINEQPASYWVRLFAQQDYLCYGGVRRRIWSDPLVEVWYRQNLLCFVRREAAGRWRSQLGEPLAADEPLVDIAHPDLLAQHAARADKLAAYADRLETEKEALRQRLDRTRAELDNLQQSRLWRLCNAAAGHARRLGRPTRRSDGVRAQP